MIHFTPTTETEITSSTSQVMLTCLTLMAPASGLIVRLTPSVQAITVKVFTAETKNKTNCLGKLNDIIILLPIPTWATEVQDQLNAML
jgi:hypothetical protein